MNVTRRGCFITRWFPCFATDNNIKKFKSKNKFTYFTMEIHNPKNTITTTSFLHLRTISFPSLIHPPPLQAYLQKQNDSSKQHIYNLLIHVQQEGNNLVEIRLPVSLRKPNIITSKFSLKDVLSFSGCHFLSKRLQLQVSYKPSYSGRSNKDEVSSVPVNL